MIVPDFIGDREKSGLNKTLKMMREAQETRNKKNDRPNIDKNMRRCERCGEYFPIDEMHVMSYEVVRTNGYKKKYQLNYRYRCNEHYINWRRNAKRQNS